jgi:hypothetical protein
LNFEQQINPLACTCIAALEELGVRIDRRKRVAYRGILSMPSCQLLPSSLPLLVGHVPADATLFADQEPRPYQR